jgi:uncharacterized protein
LFRPQRIRDPLHNLVEFEADEFESAMWGAIQTRPYQRLRRIKQLGFSDFIFPGATHSRFAHSVGVFHVARRLMKIIRKHLTTERYLETRAHAALAAALVHDVGHGPFSHAFEKVGKKLGLAMAKHEVVSDELIRNGELAGALNKLGSGFASDVADIVKSEGPQSIYAAVVSSQFDADRLDYMQRDRLMTGTQHSAIDLEWLIANLEVGDVNLGVDEAAVGRIETFVLGPKAVFAAESYVLGLFQLYPTVYLHKTTRGLELLFSELMIRAIELIRDGSVRRTGLPRKHPIVQFARDAENVEFALLLDDTVFLGALHLMSYASDKVISEAATRIRDRQLFKAIDIREKVSLALGDEASDDPTRIAKIDLACANVQLRLEGRLRLLRRQHADSLVPMMCDKDVREPYRRYQESKGPLNQIRIKRGDALVDLGERSSIVKAIESFKLDRVYLREKAGESQGFVDKVIREEVLNAKGVH